MLQMDTEAVWRLDTLGEVSAKRDIWGRILWKDQTPIKKSIYVSLWILMLQM